MPTNVPPQYREAEQRLREATTPDFIDYVKVGLPLTVIVLDDPMVNAFAAPGGQIVFFRGMIESAESPDELAAVMAHEVGHVVARDPTRLALRSVGSVGLLGLLLGDFAGGGLIVVLADQLLDSSYSREAEEKARREAEENERFRRAALDLRLLRSRRSSRVRAPGSPRSTPRRRARCGGWRVRGCACACR